VRRRAAEEGSAVRERVGAGAEPTAWWPGARRPAGHL